MTTLLTKIALLLAVSFIIAAAGSLFLDIDKDKRSELVEYGLDNPMNASGAVAKTVIGYDLSTPNWEREWIGSPDKKTYILEDTPYPDSRDLFILIPYWFVGVLIVRYLFKAQTISNWWTVAVAIGWFTIGTIIVWSLWKLIWFNLMKSGAKELGIENEVIEARSKVSGKAEKGALWLILITIVNSFALARALWPGGGSE